MLHRDTLILEGGVNEDAGGEFLVEGVVERRALEQRQEATAGICFQSKWNVRLADADHAHVGQIPNTDERFIEGDAVVILEVELDLEVDGFEDGAVGDEPGSPGECPIRQVADSLTNTRLRHSRNARRLGRRQAQVRRLVEPHLIGHQPAAHVQIEHVVGAAEAETAIIAAHVQLAIASWQWFKSGGIGEWRNQGWSGRWNGVLLREYRRRFVGGKFERRKRVRFEALERSDPGNWDWLGRRRRIRW